MTIEFDPMLAKLVVHAPDRESAIRRMDNALSSFVVLGVRTNIDPAELSCSPLIHQRDY